MKYSGVMISTPQIPAIQNAAFANLMASLSYYMPYARKRAWRLLFAQSNPPDSSYMTTGVYLPVPPGPFFVRADSKGLTAAVFVRAHSKALTDTLGRRILP